MSKVLDWLYLGGFKEASDTNWLVQNKISCVLNVASGTKDLQYPEHIDVMRVPIRDDPKEQIGQYLEFGYIYLDLARLLRKKVLVHCVAGISRSATFVIYYLMRSKNMSLSNAYNLVKLRRQKINPNSGFLATLYQKETEIHPYLLL